MIVIGNLNEIDTYVETYDGERVKLDKVYSIVKSTKNTKCENILELAPSDELYNFFLNEKKKLRWTQERFNNEFAIEYFKNINNSRGFLAVKKIFLESMDKNIFIGCFCANELMCHRILLGSILKYYGANVKSISLDINKYDYYIKLFDTYLKGL